MKLRTIMLVGVVVGFWLTNLNNLAAADIIHVPGDYPTIQAGIDAAMDGDEVVVADGTYTGDGNRDMEFGGKEITVRSENGPAACIIDLQADENDPHQAFYFGNQETFESVLDGFTIRNGFVENGGAAIGITRGSAATIRRCNFESNQGSAAVSLGSRGQVQYATLVDCLFVGNVGGALDVGGYYSLATVVNCTFARNSASSGGGAIRASAFGKTHSAGADVHNSLMWGNTPVQMSVNGNAAGIDATYCNVQDGWEGEGNIDADPRFVDPDNGDFRLSANSPGIDAGDNTAVPKGVTIDLDGNPRFHDDPCTTDTGNGGPPTVDMGAYEFQGTSVCPAELNTVEIVTGTHLGGGLFELSQSDFDYLSTRSGFGSTLVDLHNMEMIISATTSEQSPSTVDLTIESRISEPAGTAQISLWNHNTDVFDIVGQYPLGNTDATDDIFGIDAEQYVNAQGEIELSVKHIVFVPFLAFNFDSWFDWVEITAH